MLSDNFPGTPYQLGSQVTVVISVSDAQTAREVFGKLQEGGKAEVPLYGMVTDKFGVGAQPSGMSTPRASALQPRER